MTDAPIQLRQKATGIRTHFVFDETELNYSVRIDRQKQGAIVTYDKIPSHGIFRQRRVWWFRYAIVCYVAVMLMTVSYYLASNDLHRLMEVAYRGTVALGAAYIISLFTRPKGYITLPMQPPLIVINDWKKDKIFRMISERRQASRKKKFGQVDFTKPYFEESARFKWLLEEGVINAQEYQQARQKITAARNKAGGKRFDPPQQLH